MANATPENSAHTWRDIADQLTPDQVKMLEELAAEAPIRDSGLLRIARSMAGDHMLQDVYAEVLPPADATSVDEWVGASDGRVLRYFTGTGRGTTVPVAIIGDQLGDGSTIERRIFIHLDKNGAEVDAATARQIAADLLAAADELDALTAGDR